MADEVDGALADTAAGGRTINLGLPADMLETEEGSSVDGNSTARVRVGETPGGVIPDMDDLAVDLGDDDARALNAPGGERLKRPTKGSGTGSQAGTDAEAEQNGCCAGPARGLPDRICGVLSMLCLLLVIILLIVFYPP